MRLSLYERLKPEHKQKLANRYSNMPHLHHEIVRVLSYEEFFTEVKYGIAFDVVSTCDLNFFGDAFED